MDYTLRQATPADLDYLFDLHRATMREYVEATWGWNEEWQRDYFVKKYDPAARQVIQVHGRDAGVLVVEDRPDELYLALIEIAPEYQRRGLGRQIIANLLDRAATAHKTLSLHVLKSNVNARRLYERLGFVVVSDEEHKVGMACAPEGQLDAPEVK